jgi:hypothetical protein
MAQRFVAALVLLTLACLGGYHEYRSRLAESMSW